MKKLLGFTLLTMGVLLALTACQPAASTSAQEIGKTINVDGGSYKDLSVSELQSQMASKDFTLVNVHIPFAGDLPQTDLSLPYDTITHNLDKLPGDKNSKIILYCRSGAMSTIAAKELVKLGYTNIFQLDGGMDAWELAGNTLEGK